MTAHYVYHGTSRASAQAIFSNGFQESSGGMLGARVYGSHDRGKAASFANSKGGGNGAMLLVEFRTSRWKVTSLADQVWRQEGYEAVYSQYSGEKA